MQARYPKHVVVLVEGLVLPIDTDDAIDWMRERVQKYASSASISKAIVYQKERSSGTMAKPRFLSVFETDNVAAAFEALRSPYAHKSLRPLGIGSFELLPGLPRVSESRPDGGLMVGLTNCTDPAADESFNHWYNTVHAADVIASPHFWNAQRYKRLDGDLPAYAAFYETTLGGSDGLKQYMSWPERNADMHENLSNIHVWSFDFVVSLP